MGQKNGLFPGMKDRNMRLKLEPEVDSAAILASKRAK